MSRQDEEAVCIAPEGELIRYLSVMRRALTTLAHYGKLRDRAGLQFGGILANALHNVPPYLLHYDDPSIQGWLPLDRWLGRVFPGQIADSDLPAHVRAACASIVSREGELAELGLWRDRKNLCLAPVESMKHHLNVLYDICIGLRMTLGTGGERAPDDAKDTVFDWVSLVGQCLRRVPVILVRWSERRESTFWQGAIAQSSTSPAPVKAEWKEYIERAKPPWVKLDPPQEKRRVASPPGPPPAPQTRDKAAVVAPRPPTKTAERSSRSVFRVPPYQWVTDRIAVGSAVHEQDVDALVRDGITHVLDCRKGPWSEALYTQTGIVYRQIGVADDGEPKADEWFLSGIDFVTRALRSPQTRVVVHCAMGMSRSPTMVYAILLAQGMSGEEAQALIAKARTVARVTYEEDARRAAGRWVRRSKAGPKEV